MTQMSNPSGFRRRLSSLSVEASHYIPPWSSPYIIGVAGLSGSGKTTVAQQIIDAINQPWTVLLSLDNFYKPLTPEQRQHAFNNEFDFDEPAALDLDLMYQCVKNLKEGKKTDIPVYSFANHDRTDQNLSIYGANVVIIEGILSLYDKQLLDLIDCKIFVDTDMDLCYSRRLLRDIVHRGRDLEGVIKQWDTFVKPNAVSYVLPTMNNADVVIPRGSDNVIAVNMLIEHIKKQLALKSKEHLHYLRILGQAKPAIDWSRVHLLPLTNQLKVIKSIILDENTSNDDFIFYFNRLASILINEALNYIDYTSANILLPQQTITTPIGIALDPKETYFQSRPVTGVSIVRSGDCFVSSLRKTIPAARIGKLLIQTDSRTGEPQLHTEKLPLCQMRGDDNSNANICQMELKRTNVLLFDAQMISGAGVIMAIKVLLDHGWKQEDIIVVTYTSSRKSLTTLMTAFPQVQLVMGCISLEGQLDNDELDRNSDIYDKDSDWWMSTRYIDERYYGTS